MAPIDPKHIDPRFKQTALFVERGEFVHAEGKGQKKAQLEIARFLEKWHDRPGDIIDAKGNIDPDKFSAYLRDVQINHGLTGSQNDGIVGRKTLEVLVRAQQDLDIQDQYRNLAKLQPRTSSSCNLEGLKNFKGFDCPELERFMAQKKPMRTTDLKLLQNIAPLLNLPWQRVAETQDLSAPTRLADSTRKSPRDRS